MAMTKRERVKWAIRQAGYHADKKELTRLYIENRVSLSRAQEWYMQGEILRTSGMGCNCEACRPILAASLAASVA